MAMEVTASGFGSSGAHIAVGLDKLDLDGMKIAAAVSLRAGYSVKGSIGTHLVGGSHHDAVMGERPKTERYLIHEAYTDVFGNHHDAEYGDRPVAPPQTETFELVPAWDEPAAEVPDPTTWSLSVGFDLGATVRLDCMMLAAQLLLDGGPRLTAAEGAGVEHWRPSADVGRAEKDARAVAAFRPRADVRLAVKRARKAADLCWGPLRAALAQAADQLAAQFPLDQFPSWEILGDSQQAVKDKLAARFRDGAQALAAAAREELRRAFEPLLPALRALARERLGGELSQLECAVEVLKELEHDARSALAAAAAALKAAAGEGRKIGDQALWLLKQAPDAGTAMDFAVSLLEGLAAHWTQGARDAASQILKQLATDREARADTAHRLFERLARKPFVKQPSGGEIYADLCALAAAALRLPAAETGALLGRALAAFGGDPAALLAGYLATHKLDKKDFIAVLRHLGGHATLRRAAAWAVANRAVVDAALARESQRVRDELHAALAVVVTLGNGAVSGAEAGIARLLHALRFAQSLPRTVLRNPVLQQAGQAAAILDGGAPALLDLLRSQVRRTGQPLQKIARELLRNCDPSKAIGKLAQDIEQVGADVAGHDLKSAMRDWYAVVADLQGAAQDAGKAVFGGGVVEPFMVEARHHRLTAWPPTLVDPEGSLQSHGLSREAVTRDVNELAADLLSEVQSELGLLELRGRKGPLLVPLPSEVADGSRLGEQGFTTPVSIPVHLPFATEASVALSHLPSFSVLDLRYSMPFADTGSYRVADLDGDGFVRDWEVASVRAAVVSGKKQPELDLDGDGIVSAQDVELALQQQSLYVNGLMYRRASAPFGMWLALAPQEWVFCAGAGWLADESVPGKLDRFGLLYMIEAQILLSDPPLYPLRIHLEAREYADAFTQDAVLGLPPVSASERYDLVLRGGAGANDFQLYLSSDPYNLVLRTFVLRGTLYLRGLGTYGLVESGLGGAGKVDVRLQAVYEMNSPLCEVLHQWLSRAQTVVGDVTHVLEDPKQIVPIFQRILAATDIYRLIRAMIGGAGPFVRLLCAWTDPDALLDSTLAYVRAVTLGGFRQGTSYAGLAALVSAWDDAAVGAGCKQLMLEALEAQRRAGKLQGTEAVRLPAAWGGEAVKAIDEAERRGHFDAAARARARTARARVLALITSPGRSWAPALDELAGEARTGEVKVPLLGRFSVKSEIGVLAWTKTVTPDCPEGKPGRRNKPLYRSALVFGRGVKLYSAPAFKGAVATALPEFEVGVVEDSRALVQGETTWLFVRTRGFQCGYVPLAAAELAAWSSAGPDGQVQLDPLLVRASPGAIFRLKPSPPDTEDKTRFLAAARQALVHQRGPHRAGLQELHDRVVKDLAVRAFGPEEAPDHPEADLGPAFNLFPPEKQETLWRQTVASIELSFYLPRLLDQCAPALPLLVKNDLPGALDLLVPVLRKCVTFELDALKEAAKEAAPNLLDVVPAVVDVALAVKQGITKVKEVVDAHAAANEGKDNNRKGILEAKEYGRSWFEPGQFHDLLLVKLEELRNAVPLGTVLTPGEDWARDVTLREPDEVEAEAAKSKADAAAKRKDTSNWRDCFTANLKELFSELWATVKYGGESVADGAFAVKDGVSGVSDFLTDSHTIGDGDAYQDHRDQEEKKRKARTVYQTDFGLDFGKDSITLTVSMEEAGGGGAGDSVESEGADAAVTAGLKYYLPKPRFSLAALIGDDPAQSFGILTRFFLRYAHHLLFAINSAGKFIRDSGVAASGTSQKAVEAMGRDAFWTLTFAIGALFDAMRDLMNDHPKFIVRMLEGVGVECEGEVNVDMQGEMSFAVDANAAVSLKAFLPLSTLVAPFLPLLAPGQSGADNQASILDLIVPKIDVTLEDRICVKLGETPISLELESTGPLAEGHFTIPHGSPLSVAARELAALMSKGLQWYLDEKKKPLDPGLARGQALLDELDLLVQATLLAGKDPNADPAATASMNPLVSMVMGGLTGDGAQVDEPVDEHARVMQARQRLLDSGVKGVQVTPGAMLEALATGAGRCKASLYVSDEERTRLEQGGFAPDGDPVPALQNAVYELALPSAPGEIGWNTWTDPVDLLDPELSDHPERRRSVSGVVAAFETRDAALAFTEARDASWTSDEKRFEIWEREARHWAWVETQAVPQLIARHCALPRLELTGATLRATFTGIQDGALDQAEGALLATRTAHQRLWKFVLAANCTREEYALLHDAVARNRAQ